MNSSDPLFKNYMALFLSIVSKHSVTQSLIAIGYFNNPNKKKYELQKKNYDDDSDIAHDDF